MKQNQQFRGLGLVLLVIALIMFASSLTSQGSLFSQEMTHQEFMVAVENKTIESVDINQNQQPPTGRAGTGQRLLYPMSRTRKNFFRTIPSITSLRMSHRRTT